MRKLDGLVLGIDSIDPVLNYGLGGLYSHIAGDQTADRGAY